MFLCCVHFLRCCNCGLPVINKRICYVMCYVMLSEHDTFVVRWIYGDKGLKSWESKLYDICVHLVSR